MDARNPGEDIGCPAETVAAIAWYHEPGLAAELRGRIEAHAAQCADCRVELEWARGEALTAAARAPDADALYARVHERIERARAGEAAAARDALPPARSHGWRRLALAASLLAALLGGYVAGALRPGALAPLLPVYEAATASPAADGGAATAAAPSIDVIFRPDVPVERINDALRAIGGELVAGPTRLGVYRIRLAAGADAAAAARLLKAEGSGVASFAEAVAH